MAQTITPLFARVVVQPQEQAETTASGIVLAPNASKEKPMQGEVIATGPDCKAVKKGDTVLFKKYSPTEVGLGGEEFFLMDEEDILGTIAQ